MRIVPSPWQALQHLWPQPIAALRQNPSGAPPPACLLLYSQYNRGTQALKNTPSLCWLVKQELY